MSKGWRNESHRHSLASKGIKTVPRKKFVSRGSSGVWFASDEDLREPWRLTSSEYLSYTREVVSEPFDKERFVESAFILPSGEYVYLDFYGHRHYIGGFDSGWIRKSSIGSGTPAYEVKSWSKNVENLILDDILSFNPVNRYISVDVAGDGYGYSFPFAVLHDNDYKLRNAFRDSRTEVVPYVSSFDDREIKEVRTTIHENSIYSALEEGKPVPQSVLEDYPELGGKDR